VAAFGQDASSDKKSTGSEMKHLTKTAAKNTEKGAKTAGKDTEKAASKSRHEERGRQDCGRSEV